jgi:hypothetical protein
MNTSTQPTTRPLILAAAALCLAMAGNADAQNAEPPEVTAEPNIDEPEDVERTAETGETREAIIDAELSPADELSPRPATFRRDRDIDGLAGFGPEGELPEENLGVVTGTLVDLESYLMRGAEAARLGTARIDVTDPVAILTDQDELYLVLDRYEMARRAYAGNTPQSPAEDYRDRIRRSPADTNISVDLEDEPPEIETIAEDVSLAEGPTGTAVDIERRPRAEGGAEAERPGQRELMRDRQLPEQPLRFRALRVGQRITVRGPIFERHGLNAILIDALVIRTPTEQAAEESGSPPQAEAERGG